MKTIAQQLKIKEFPFTIKDSNGKKIYYENSTGFWAKREYDADGKEIYCEWSDGTWVKQEYDAAGNLIHFVNSTGFWGKREYDAAGKMIYFEDSNGYIMDNRPKTDVQKAIDLLTAKGLILDGKILKTKL